MPIITIKILSVVDVVSKLSSLIKFGEKNFQNEPLGKMLFSSMKETGSIHKIIYIKHIDFILNHNVIEKETFKKEFKNFMIGKWIMLD